jgi:hypothetical protein
MLLPSVVRFNRTVARRTTKMRSAATAQDAMATRAGVITNILSSAETAVEDVTVDGNLAARKHDRNR